MDTSSRNNHGAIGCDQKRSMRTTYNSPLILGQEVPFTNTEEQIIVKIVTDFAKPNVRLVPMPGTKGDQGIQGIQGIQGVQGISGPEAITNVSSPLSINTETKTVGLDQTAFNLIYDDRYLLKGVSIDAGEI